MFDASAMVSSFARSMGREIASIPTTTPVPTMAVNDDHYACAGCGEKKFSSSIQSTAEGERVFVVSEFEDDLKRCTGCRLVRYCSRDCQVSHRRAHKSFCNREKKLREDDDDAQLLLSADLIDASYWKSVDHGDFYAYLLMPMFQRSIFVHSNNLFNRKWKRQIVLGNAKDADQLLQIPHDAKLFPTWKRLAYALSNCPEGPIELFAIWHVDLTKEVLEILSPSLEILPIKRLSFSGNAMDNECIRIVTKIIEKNLTIEEFDCESNRPQDIEVNRRLFAAVEAHPNLEIYKTCSLHRTFNPSRDKKKDDD